MWLGLRESGKVGDQRQGALMGFFPEDNHAKVRTGGHRDSGYGACHISEHKARASATETFFF